MRILQLSDPHILAGVGEEIYGVDSFGSLERVLAAGLSSGPELIVVTGDVAERRDGASYERVVISARVDQAGGEGQYCGCTAADGLAGARAGRGGGAVGDAAYDVGFAD